MSFSDEEIGRLREAFASLARTAATTTNCPAPETLWRAAAGELPAEVRDLVDHTVGCPSCAEEWRLARELISNAPSSVADLPVDLSQSRSGWWLAAAAAAVVVVVGVPLWRATVPGGPPDAETLRAPGDFLTVESLVAEDVVLSRTSCDLRWTAGAEPGLTYDLLVATESLDVLIREEGLEEAAYRVPAEVLDGVPPGGKLLWQVEAIGLSGSRVTSRTFVHRLQ